MNELYPLVEQAFRSYSEASILRLLTELANKPGQKGEHFGLSLNNEYVLKRLLGAILARDPNLKFNAYLALTALSKELVGVKAEALYEYIASLSNYKKHCQGKVIEIESYVVGKILTFKALKSVFQANLNAINHLIVVLTAFPEYQEQIIELISELATSKKAIAVFNKLSPTTKAGFVLFTILQSKLKNTVPELNKNVICDVLEELLSVYPKRSICLDHLGPGMKSFLDVPSAFFEEQLSSIFQSESEVNIKMLFYLLQLLGGHLRGAKITKDNVWKIVSVKVLGGWILQLKVKNKHVRRMAESISVEFDSEPALATKILTELHDQSLYLQNINHKHPLFCLYQNVEPHQYAQYLLELIAGDAPPQQDSQHPHKGYYNELQVFLVARHKDLTIEQICKIIVVFVNRYHRNKDESALQAVNTIFNALLSSNPKKTQVLQNRASLVLSKLSFEELQLSEQQQSEVKQINKQIRSKFKADKQEKDVFNVAYYNFLLSAGFFFLIYPEQIQLYGDLEIVQREIKANILFSESGVQPKKKRKTDNDDKHKPIHILIEIFITMLTKSSQFLRNSINLLFEQIVPYVGAQDIANLLNVITKSDTELVDVQQVGQDE